MVSVDCMLISKLSVSVEALEMLCAVVAEVLLYPKSDIPSSPSGSVQALTESTSCCPL